MSEPFNQQFIPGNMSGPLELTASLMIVEQNDVPSTPARLNFDFASPSDDLQSSRTNTAAPRSYIARSTSQRYRHLRSDAISESVSALQLLRASSKSKSNAQQQIYHSSRPVARLPGLDHPAGLRPKVCSLSHHPAAESLVHFAVRLRLSIAACPRHPQQPPPLSAYLSFRPLALDSYR